MARSKRLRDPPPTFFEVTQLILDCRFFQSRQRKYQYHFDCYILHHLGQEIVFCQSQDNDFYVPVGFY
jgi:hypothetical protein